MSRGKRRWWICLCWSAVVAIVALTVGPGRVAVAQNVTRFDEDAETLPGIVQAASRMYRVGGGNAHAFVFGFDSETNASAALETINAEYEGEFAEDAVAVDDLGTKTWAYVQEGTWTEVLTHEGVYVYIVSIVSYASDDADLDFLGLATTLIEAMIAAGAGDGLGEYHPDGSSTGGVWDKLPTADEAPPGFRVQQDEQYYPARGNPEDGGIDFGALAGIQRVVQRTYVGDITALGSPESAPASTIYLAAGIAAFDTADHAAAALEPIRAQVLQDYAEIWSIAPESVDLGDLGDRAVADVGSTELNGVIYEQVTVIVLADAYLYLVAAVGVGSDAGTLETATGVAESMLSAEAGGDNGVFDETGSSSGGLWDKFPVAGEAVLGSLLPQDDEQIYP